MAYNEYGKDRHVIYGLKKCFAVLGKIGSRMNKKNWYSIAHDALTQMETAEIRMQKAKEDYEKGASILFQTVRSNTSTLCKRVKQPTAYRPVWVSKRLEQEQEQEKEKEPVKEEQKTAPVKTEPVKEEKKPVKTVEAKGRMKPRNFQQWVETVGLSNGTQFQIRQHQHRAFLSLDGDMKTGYRLISSSPILESNHTIDEKSPNGVAARFIAILKELRIVQESANHSDGWDTMSVQYDDTWVSLKDTVFGITWDGVAGTWKEEKRRQ